MRRAPSTELSGHRQPCPQPRPSCQEGNKSGKEETKWLRWLFALFPPPPSLPYLSLSLRAAENNTIAEVWERNQLVNGRSLSPVFRPAARRAQLLQRSNQSGAIWLITRLSEAGSRCKKAGNALLAASTPATPSQTQTQDLSYTLRS